MAADPTFEVETSVRATTRETLLVGFSNPGMAGLTASDYLVDHLDCEQIGRVSAQEFPSVVPFEDGRPRHHTRLYDVADRMTLLTSELWVPPVAAEAFADGVLDWSVGAGFEEIVVLNGVPFGHGPDEHAVFHVATEQYRDRRLDDSPYDPLSGGFFEGVVGELLALSLDGTLPPAGVLVTPTHPPGPDLDAALLFLEALESLYDLPVDPSALQERSEELKRYYSELADRVQSAEAEEGRSYPEDRAYM